MVKNTAIYPHRKPIKCLAFDGGDTLIKVFPQYKGPMYKWPEIIPIKGIKETLAMLGNQFTLITASNAIESGSKEMRAALKRCNLDTYFEHIFTAKELKASKPQLEFFRHIELTLGIDSENIALVGDSYPADISGAFLAGWKSIWFNPDYLPCPGLTPLHDAEINTMGELNNCINDLVLPNINDCLILLLKNDTSYYLLQHVQTVAAISYLLAVWLKKRGIKVDAILAHRGGLLHDLAKLHNDFSTVSDHGKLAADILHSMGQPRLAEITRKHILSTILDEKLKPQTWEEKVVFFADKLVEGSNIVTVEQRLAALNQRYKIGDIFLTPILGLQSEICIALNMSPKQLMTKINSEAYYGNKTK